MKIANLPDLLSNFGSPSCYLDRSWTTLAKGGRKKGYYHDAGHHKHSQYKKVIIEKMLKQVLGKPTIDLLMPIFLLMIYSLIFAPSIFARVSDSEFMIIDPRSIMAALEGLTSHRYYNMNKQYHSQYYGWTYFSLNFFVLMFGKLLGLTSELAVNLSVRIVLFVIGGALTFYAYRVARYFFPILWSSVAVAAFMFSPVSAHYFVFIHPETLGILCQLIALDGFIRVYRADAFPRKTFFRAVVFLSLSALCKQSFFIVGVFIYIGFSFSYARCTIVGRNMLNWKSFSQLTLRGVGIFTLVLFLIHPYAILQPGRFLRAQAELTSQHSAISFWDVSDIWFQVILSNFAIAIGFILLLAVFLRSMPLPYKISVVFAGLVMLIFISNATLFVLADYIYPVYAFLFFNAFYVLVKVILPTLRAAHLGRASTPIMLSCLAPLAFVTASNLSFSVTTTHSRYLLDGLSTVHVAWDKIKSVPAGSKIAYSPNLAVLEPFKSAGCSGWQGCATPEGLDTYAPDYVMFSQGYKYFDGPSFIKFVTNNNYTLLTEINPDTDQILQRCQPNFAAPYTVVQPHSLGKALWFYVENPLNCLRAYQAALQAHRTGRIVEGDKVQIFAKN